MPNQLDLLLALDVHARASPMPSMSPQAITEVASAAGLVEPGHSRVGNWVGLLVDLGYMKWAGISGGDRRPVPPGHIWSDSELQRFSDYFILPAGRDEAERMRRHARERLTDVALGVQAPNLVRDWMGDEQSAAIARQFDTLRAALDDDRGADAIGAAKNLVEAVSHVRLAAAAIIPGRHDNLVKLYQAAAACNEDDHPDLAKRLASVVDALGKMRNDLGSGHGQPASRQIDNRDARLAAAAAVALSTHLLADA